MAEKNENEYAEILRRVDEIIAAYADTSDPKVKKVVNRLKRARKTITAIDAVQAANFLIFADKIYAYIQKLLSE